MAIIRGTRGDDLLPGTADPDEISGLQGHDTVHGGDGDDTIHGDDGNDILDGEAGQDSAFGGNGNDTLTSIDDAGGLLDGGNGNDRFVIDFSGYLSNVDLVVRGGNGHDSFVSYSTGPNLLGFIFGADMYGNAGDDTFTFDRTQASLIDGGSGNDRVSISNMLSGEIHGGSGSDRVELSLMLGTITGDAGNDVVTIGSAKSGSRIHGGEGHDVMSAERGRADMWGDAGNDYLYSGLDNNFSSRLYGGTGHDILKSLGLDVLDGEEGRDILESAAYGNTLTGGAGADLFVYGSLVQLNPSIRIRTDTITDFDTREGDRLDLSVLLDRAQASGDPVAGGWLGVESVSDGTALLFDPNGGGDGFLQLAILQGVTLSAADLSLVVIA